MVLKTAILKLRQLGDSCDSWGLAAAGGKIILNLHIVVVSKD